MDEEIYQYSAGSPPERLKRLYYLNAVVALSTMVVAAVTLLTVVVSIGGGTGEMKILAWVVAAEVLLAFAVEALMRRRLEEAVLKELPAGWHLIYRWRVIGRGTYIPEVVFENEFRALFGKPVPWYWAWGLPAKMSHADRSLPKNPR
jgi:hypothetical protein